MVVSSPLAPHGTRPKLDEPLPFLLDMRSIGMGDTPGLADSDVARWLEELPESNDRCQSVGGGGGSMCGLGKTIVGVGSAHG